MATLETLTIDELALNDNVTFRLESLSMPPPAKRPEWVAGGDTDGAVLGRDPLSENRVIEAKVRVLKQATMDLALAKIALVSDKFEEAERNINGIDTVWTPGDATRSLTFRCLSGEITDLPITVTGDDAGWFTREPVFTVRLTCLPFGHGTEVISAAITSALPLITIELSGVAGDVPAEGRLIVTDAATQARRHVEWGIESRHYPTTSPPSLTLDSDQLVTTGFSGAQWTRAGAYDPNGTGTTTVRSLMVNQPTAVCGTGNQPHVGTFRVKAAVRADYQNGPGAMYVRLAWQDGDGPLRANTAASPPTVTGFYELNLGTITITEKVLGAQHWTGRIEAWCDTPYNAVEVDYLMLVPAGEGYGLARGSVAYSPGSYVASDEFVASPVGTPLNGRVAPLGGTWATAGATGDFGATDGPFTDESASRSVSTDTALLGRFGTLGAARTSGETNALMSVSRPTDTITSGALRMGLVARYVDTTNHLIAYVKAGADTRLQVVKVSAGAETLLVDVRIGVFASEYRRLRLIVHASGNGMVRWETTGQVLHTASFYDASLATGGTLASGASGIYDYASSTLATQRFYTHFGVLTADESESIVMYPGRSLQIRSDQTLRENATGTLYGAPPAYRGSRFLVPPAGTRGRKTRVAVKARRSDIDTSPDTGPDNLTVQVAITPRFLAVPR